MSGPKAPPPFDDFRRIDSFSAISEILRAPGVKQRPRPFADPLEAGTLFKLSGDEHRARRGMESALFSGPTLQAYEREILVPSIERAIEELAGQRGPDGLVRADLVQLSRRMVMPITATIVGLDGVDSFESGDDLWDLLVAFENGIKVYFLPGDPAPVVERALHAKAKYWETYVRPSLERRERILAEEGVAALPLDLVSLLAQERTKSNEWDDDLVLRECILYLVASGGTTSGALSHVLVELQRWLEANPADRASLNDHEFLSRMLDEALRLHPPSPALLRDCPVAFHGSLVDLEPDEPLFLSLAAGNVDQEVFGESACEFDPARELPEGVPRHGLTFGAGRHLCIGRPLVVGARGAGTSGAAVLILDRLLAAGVRLDKDRPPTYVESIDRYDELPVVFDRL